MSKSILRHMHITDWQLRRPEALPYAPQGQGNRGAPVCWVIGDVPAWIDDLCRVLHVTDVHQVSGPDELPPVLAEQDWLLWGTGQSIPEDYPHARQLSFSSASSAKQQLWHQICQHDY